MPVQAEQSSVKPHPRSIPGFCQRHSICVATFYNLAKRDAAPRVMKLGARSVITEDAEAEWLRKMQSEHAA